MANALQAVRGMNDMLPDEAPLWGFLEDTVRDVFRQYGYRNIRTPIVEKTELFVRGVGHLSLPIHGRVVHEICATLAHLDHDGSTLTAGVTPITSTTPAAARRDRSRPFRRRRTDRASG